MTKASNSAPTCRPLWVPADVSFDSLSPALQAGLVQLINPLYQKLVLQGNNEIERTTGLTLAHLAWLELLGQVELGQAVAAGLAGGPGSVESKAIAQHLSLVTAKIKATKLYLQVKRTRQDEDELDLLSEGQNAEENHENR